MPTTETVAMVLHQQAEDAARSAEAMLPLVLQQATPHAVARSELSAAVPTRAARPRALGVGVGVGVRANGRPASSTPIARWSPLLAAACVLLVIFGVAITFGNRHAKDAAGPPIPALVDHPWHAQAISSNGADNDSLIGHGSALYGLTTHRARAELVRIDPQTGAVLDTALVPFDSTDSVEPFTPVYAGGRIWVVSLISGSRVRLSGFDLSLSSSIQRQFPLTLFHGYVVQAITAPGNGSALYLATGPRVLVLNPRNARVRTAIHVASPIADMSASPDGRTLYVAAGNDRVLAIDTGTHRVRARYPLPGSLVGYGNEGVLNDLTATDSGFFVPTVSQNGGRHRGRHLPGFFVNTADGRRVAVDTGGGDSVTPLTDRAGRPAWAGGSSRLACINPDTGRIAASVALGAGTSIHLTELGGRLYGSYLHNPAHGPSTTALVRLTPPASCGLG